MDDYFVHSYGDDFFAYKGGASSSMLGPLDYSESCTPCMAVSSDQREHTMIEMKQLEFKDLLDIDAVCDLKTEPSTPISVPIAEDMRKCPKCTKECKGYKGLKQHLAKVHTNRKKSALCESCGKFFKHKYALKFHVKQVHERSTRVACELCGKDFYNKYTLKKHSLLCRSSLN